MIHGQKRKQNVSYEWRKIERVAAVAEEIDFKTSDFSVIVKADLQPTRKRDLHEKAVMYSVEIPQTSDNPKSLQRRNWDLMSNRRKKSKPTVVAVLESGSSLPLVYVRFYGFLSGNRRAR